MRYWSLFYSSAMLLAAAASAPATAATDGIITTDIAVSEWGASESLVLNMRTGEYTVTAFPNAYPPTKPNAQMSQRGTLSQDELRKIQPAYRSALTQGLIDRQCDQDPQRNRLIVGNGRVPSLTMKMGGKVYRAARSYQCWTPAAHVLNRQLEDSFKQVSLQLSGKMRAVAEMSVPAQHVKWHPDYDRSEVWVYNPPCPKAGANEIASCHWSIPTTPPGVSAFIAEHKLARYSVVFADLNGDDQPEALVYAVATTGGGEADLCGSGGCDLYVLSLTSTGYHEVGRVSISHPPIRILRTTTKGWHDISVRVAGGGINPGYDARLQYNGVAYPGNPSVPPATRLGNNVGVVAITAMPPLP